MKRSCAFSCRSKIDTHLGLLNGSPLLLVMELLLHHWLLLEIAGRWHLLLVLLTTELLRSGILAHRRLSVSRLPHWSKSCLRLRIASLLRRISSLLLITGHCILSHRRVSWWCPILLWHITWRSLLGIRWKVHALVRVRRLIWVTSLIWILRKLKSNCCQLGTQQSINKLTFGYILLS